MYGMFLISTIVYAYEQLVWCARDGVWLSFSQLSLLLPSTCSAFFSHRRVCMCVCRSPFRSCFYAHLMCRRCIIFNWSNINFPSNERDILCMVVKKRTPFHPPLTPSLTLPAFFLPSLFRLYSSHFGFPSGFFEFIFFFLSLFKFFHFTLRFLYCTHWEYRLVGVLVYFSRVA